MTPAEPMGAIFTTAAEPAHVSTLSEIRDAVRKMARPAHYVRMSTEQWLAVVNDKSWFAKSDPQQPHDNMMGFPVVIAGSAEDVLRILRGEKSIDLTKSHGIDPDEVRK